MSFIFVLSVNTKPYHWKIDLRLTTFSVGNDVKKWHLLYTACGGVNCNTTHWGLCGRVTHVKY